MDAPRDLAQALETLARIEATAEEICRGIELLDPDLIGRDLIRQVDELAALMAELQTERPGEPSS